jgi:hypothetical protein
MDEGNDDDDDNRDEGNDDDDDQNESNDAGAVEGGGLLDERVHLPKLPEEDVALPQAVAQGTGPEMSVCKHCQKSHKAYEKQCEVAGRLFEKMQTEIKSGGFTNFELFILVPNLNSLYKQTVNRLDNFILETRKVQGDAKTAGDSKDHRAFLAGPGSAARVFKSNLRAQTNKDIHASMEQRIQQEKDTLFLLIHDEAHYEATRTDKDNAVNTFINSKTVLDSSNVLTLLVSATPYNLVSLNTRIPEQNVVDWMKDEKDQDESEYFGLKKFVENLSNADRKSGYIGADEDFKTLFEDKWPTYESSLPNTRNAGGKNDTAGRKDDFRCELLTKDYTSAMKKFSDQSSANAESDSSKVSTHTLKIVEDLLNVVDKKSGACPFPKNNGCMVLVRVARKKHGKHMADQLREARTLLGFQQRFAILLDVEEKSAGGMEKILKSDSSGKSEELGWLNRLRLLHNKPESWVPESYEDLKDLPVILILCERGRMGDTFPKSLRYYDLRMRYANSCSERAPVEQDLGRAFRYGPETDEYPFPIVLVGAECATQLYGDGKTRSQKKEQLLQLHPDEKMEKAGKREKYPEDEFNALKIYRTHWKAKSGHYDYENAAPNARRFLLVGRPQIGKTGAFLHLVYLLWRKYGREVKLPEPENVEPPDATEDPDQDQPSFYMDEEKINMDTYPNFQFMREKIKFRDEPGRGKYGNPRDPKLIAWYLYPRFSKEIHEEAKESTTAAPKQVGNSVDGALETSGSARGKALVVSTARPKKGEQANDSSTSRFPHKRCKHKAGRVKDPKESFQELMKRLGYTSEILSDRLQIIYIYIYIYIYIIYMYTYMCVCVCVCVYIYIINICINI